MLTAVKHRFGSTGEVGIFEMRDDGLRAVPDPGPLLLGDRMAGVPGSVVVPVLQGRRPLLVEVQALIGASAGGAAGGQRPITLGIDATRVTLFLALLSCRAGIISNGGQVFVSAVGGINVSEPAVDLAVAVAVASAALEQAVPDNLIVFGELGLAGELRAVPGAERRLAEAARAGFTRAIVPASTPKEAFAAAPGMVIEPVRTLGLAVGMAVDLDLCVDPDPSKYPDAFEEARRQVEERVPEGTMSPWSNVAASR
jgi:DNA repair protein RadA/Sms